MSKGLVDYIAWRVGKWYLRRRLERARPKIAAAGLVAAIVLGAVLASPRRPASN